MKTIPGIDSFLSSGPDKTKRTGLITNQTGITSTGTPSWKALIEAGFNLTALFGPEHGFTGSSQDAVPVKDSSLNGIPVYSLFGTRMKPGDELINSLERIIYDIQDVGCRYYTYLYTLAYTMEECEKIGIELIVLDRPNPIGMYGVEGNIIPGKGSFLGGYGLPNIYGLTIGEYAQYIKSYFYPGTDLHVVKMKNYLRVMSFHETGLPWISPSPNIPSPSTAEVYPGTCLFEGTSVSEGRGTTRPFEIIGAPWIDGELLRSTLNNLDIPGVTFTSVYFTPVFSKYRNELCRGITVHVTDRETFKPLMTGAALLHTIAKLYPDSFKWKRDWEDDNAFFIDKLTGLKNTPDALKDTENFYSFYSRITKGTDTFIKIRAEHLLYP